MHRRGALYTRRTLRHPQSPGGGGGEVGAPAILRQHFGAAKAAALVEAGVVSLCDVASLFGEGGDLVEDAAAIMPTPPFTALDRKKAQSAAFRRSVKAAVAAVAAAQVEATEAAALRRVDRRVRAHRKLVASGAVTAAEFEAKRVALVADAGLWPSASGATAADAETSTAPRSVAPPPGRYDSQSPSSEQPLRCCSIGRGPPCPRDDDDAASSVDHPGRENDDGVSPERPETPSTGAAPLEAAATIDFSNKRDVTDSDVIDAIRLFAKSPVREIVLPSCRRLTDAGLTAIATHCAQLRHLDVSWCTNLTDITLTAIATHCPQLQYLNVSYCSKLTGAALTALAAQCPQLRLIN